MGLGVTFTFSGALYQRLVHCGSHSRSHESLMGREMGYQVLSGGGGGCGGRREN
jgi:hypothetical protein